MSWLDRFFTSKNYGLLQINGVALPPESIINFVGATGADDPSNGRSTVTVSGGSGDTLTSSLFSWIPTSTPSVRGYSYIGGVTTSGTTPGTIFTIPIRDETQVDIIGTIEGRSTTGDSAEFDVRITVERTAGVITTLRNESTNGLSGNPGGWAGAFSVSGSNVLLKGTGGSGKTVIWGSTVDTLETTVTSTPPSFIPSDLGGKLYRWIDPSNSGSVSLSGGNVTAVTDLSGNSNGLSSSSGPEDPPQGVAAINGLNTIAPAGSHKLLSGDDSALTETEISIVLKASTASGTDYGLWLMSSDTNGDLYPKSDGSLSMSFGSTTRRTGVSVGAQDISTAKILTIISTSTEYTILLNGVQLFTSGTNSVAVSAGVGWWGENYVGAFYTGDFGENVHTNVKLTSDERTSVIGYLATKWGITL